MAIDARAGVGMLGSLAAWPEAAGQQAALQAFYADLQRQIDGGLNASVRSTGAYKKAAKAILVDARHGARASTPTRARSPARRAWSSCRSRSPRRSADAPRRAAAGSRYGAPACRYPVSST